MESPPRRAGARWASGSGHKWASAHFAFCLCAGLRSAHDGAGVVTLAAPHRQTSAGNKASCNYKRAVAERMIRLLTLNTLRMWPLWSAELPELAYIKVPSTCEYRCH